MSTHLTTTTPPISTPVRRFVPGGTVQAVTWLVIVVGVLLPVVPLCYASVRDRPVYEPGGVFTLASYRQLFTDPAFWQSVRNTLEFAGLSTVIGVGFGAGAAIACSRTDILGRRVWSRLLLAP